MLEYPIKLTKDDNDTVLATSPDFPEMTTFGDDNDDALLHAVDALEEAIAARMADRMDIPEPSKRGKYRVALPTQTAIKVLLYLRGYSGDPHRLALKVVADVEKVLALILEKAEASR